jgi:hypothetical protein
VQNPRAYFSNQDLTEDRNCPIPCGSNRCARRARGRYSSPHTRLAALVWPDRQHRDSDSRSSDPESRCCRLHRDGAYLDDFDLRGLWLGVGVHLAVTMKARRRKVWPALLLRNLSRLRCFRSSQSLRTPVSQRIRDKRSLRSLSTASSDRARTARMNLFRKLTWAVSCVASALVLEDRDWALVLLAS